MLKIRLSRVGKSNTPIYRLVVAEKSRAVKRENLEILGLYNPTNKKDKFQVNKERVLFWIARGAKPSDTANNLLCDFEVLAKKNKIKITYAKAEKKKASTTQKETPVNEDKTENPVNTKESIETTEVEPEVKEEIKSTEESENNNKEKDDTER